MLASCVLDVPEEGIKFLENWNFDVFSLPYIMIQWVWWYMVSGFQKI